MTIWIVEDDELQLSWLKGLLETEVPGARIRKISTELEFRNALEDLKGDPPDLIILDIMLRWTDPAPDMIPAPAEVRENQFFRAGIRCERLLRQDPRTQEVPVILYTVLEEGDLQQADFDIDLHNLHKKTRYINKASDPSQLLAAVRSALSEAVGS